MIDTKCELEVATDSNGDEVVYLKHPLEVDTGTEYVPLTYQILDEVEGRIVLKDNGFTAVREDSGQSGVVEDGLFVE